MELFRHDIELYLIQQFRDIYRERNMTRTYKYQRHYCQIECLIVKAENFDNNLKTFLNKVNGARKKMR